MRFLSSMVALLFLRSTSILRRPSVTPLLTPFVAAAFVNTPKPAAAGTASTNKNNIICFHSSSSLGMSASSSSSGSKLVRGEGNAFPSWSFEKPCDTMEWNKFVGERISVQVSSDDDFSGKGNDLVIVGVQPPAKAKEGEEAEEEEEDVTTPIELTGKAKEIDATIGGGLTQILTEQVKTFKNGAKFGDTTSIVRVVTTDEASGTPKVNKYILIGLGKNSTAASGIKLGSAIASVLVQKESNGIKNCAVLLPISTLEDGEQSKQFFSDFSSSFYTSLYSDNRFKGLKVNALDKAENLTQVTFHVPSSSDVEAAAAGITQGKSIAKGLYLTKDIVNAPHNVLNSLGLANVARRIAKESSGKIKCQILSRKECEDRGMGAFLGVARGSEADPQFIHLTYKPSGKVV